MAEGAGQGAGEAGQGAGGAGVRGDPVTRRDKQIQDCLSWPILKKEGWSGGGGGRSSLTV